MASAPERITGVRLDWSGLPAPVLAWVDQVLGSPVVAAVTQPGGFSPGPAARVRCADGTRAFVKAVGTVLNPDSPRLYRAEGRIAARLPADAPVPRLRAVFDDGDWVALVFDEIDGRMPAWPWRDADVRRVLAALVDLHRSLTPCPVPGVQDLADMLHDDLAGYARLAAAPPDDLSDWERRNLDRLADAGLAVREHLSGDTLCHVDVRADNVLLCDDGRVFVVDWPWASRGAAWVDSAMLLVDVAHSGRDPEPYLAGHPLFADVPGTQLTGLLIGLAGLFAESCRRPSPVGLPTVREFQRAQCASTVGWVRRRTGWR